MADERSREIALARARAEAERRRRARETDQMGEFNRQADPSAWQKAGNLAAEVNTGILSMIPGARGLASEVGIGYAPGVEPQTAAGRGARYLGMAAPAAIAAPWAGARAVGQGASTVAPLVQPGQGTIRNIGAEIARTAGRNPGTYYGSEAAAAVGSGAAGQMAREGNAGPVGQFAAEILGAMGPGGLAATVPRSIRGARDAARANLTPFTEQGGSVRASRQMQDRAGGPQGAREAADRLSDVPEGVTPAQWIGNERLMAQEARLLADNPELERQVRNDLEDARLAAQVELRDMFGNPRSRQDWEKNVLESITPEGANIPSGQTDEMLDAAFRSFEPLYSQVSGYTVNVPMVTSGYGPIGNRQSLDSTLESVMRSAAGNVSDDVVDSSVRWLRRTVAPYVRQISEGTLSSDDILSLRTALRRERRTQLQRGEIARAEMAGETSGYLTSLLRKSLPEEAVNTLDGADSYYRKYKIVEDAIYNAGDSQVTPEQLSQSIRRGGLTTPSSYARGTDEVTQEMRQLALAGRSTEEVLGDPRRARQFVQGLPANAKRAVQADFMDTLFNRATAQSRDATESGTPFVSGRQLVRDINENRSVMRSLGMSNDEIERAQNIGRQIQRMEQRSPEAVENLLEDGPASIAQLGAALVGAKGGQRLAGGGLGSSMVMAQYMSNKARNTLSRLTSDEAERLMKDAVRDPELYKALLTRKNASRGEQRERARYLESWLLAAAADKALDEETEQ